MRPPETRKMFQRYERRILRDLRRDRPRLFRALAEFANIRGDAKSWTQFTRRWPDFFPESEYSRVAKGEKPSILEYPLWLNQIWIGGESEPYLPILLGIQYALEPAEEGTPEDSWIVGLATIPAHFYVDWEEGVFRYEGGCDFQRALYLLFLDSWRARVCKKCDAKFIAARAAQKFCSTDCSEAMQREFRRRWWAKHGEAWRRKRRKKGKTNVTHKAR